MGFPKIVYPSGGGTTLTFVYPNTKQPYVTYGTTRHDNIASAGTIEAVYERRDEFLNLLMENVKSGADVVAWAAFFTGIDDRTPFDFYPDATLGSYTTYTLEDTNFDAAYKSLGMFTFSMKFRKYVAPPAAPVTPSSLSIPAAPDEDVDNAYDVLEGSATVSVVDPDYVTVLDITGPLILTRNILITATVPNATGAATISWRVSINGAVVETRTGLSYTDDAAERYYRLLLRGPDDIQTLLSSFETSAGEFPWLACTSVKVERKVTVIGSADIVVGVRTAGVYLDPGTVVDNPTGMSTISGSRSATAIDADFVTIASYLGEGVISGVGWVSEQIDAGAGASSIRCLIDGIAYNVQTGAGNTSVRYFPMGPMRGYNFANGPLSSNPGNISTIFAWANVRFRSSFKLQSKVTAIDVGKTLSYAAKALIMTYA